MILYQLMIGDKERLIGFTVGKDNTLLDISIQRRWHFRWHVRNQQMHAHHRLLDVIRKNIQLGLLDEVRGVQQQGNRVKESCDSSPSVGGRFPIESGS